MTKHHPPHDHPDFESYLDTLTDDDLAAVNAGQPDPGTGQNPPPTETDNT
jgi:hypothetical protein